MHSRTGELDRETAGRRSHVTLKASDEFGAGAKSDARNECPKSGQSQAGTEPNPFRFRQGFLGVFCCLSGRHGPGTSSPSGVNTTAGGGDAHALRHMRSHTDGDSSGNRTNINRSRGCNNGGGAVARPLIERSHSCTPNIDLAVKKVGMAGEDSSSKYRLSVDNAAGPLPAMDWTVDGIGASSAANSSSNGRNNQRRNQTYL